MDWTVGNVTILVTWSCYLVLFCLLLRRRLDRQSRSTTLAQRLGRLGLDVLLLPLTLYLAYVPLLELAPLAVLTPAVALGLWAFAPRYVNSKVVPLALIAIAFQGFGIVRSIFRGDPWPSHYGLTFLVPVGPNLVLLQAVIFAIAGFWLLGRSIDASSRTGSLLLREPFTRADERPRPWWGLLLLVVVALTVELLGWTLWLGTPWWGAGQTLAVVAAVVIMTIRFPALAANLALAGLVLFGLYGVALGVFWPTHVPLPSPWTVYVRYGAILVTSRAWALVAGVQGLGLVGLGLWLTPRALDDRTKALFRSATEAELTSRVRRLTSSRADAADTATIQLRRIERDLHDGAQSRLVALGMSLRAVERLIGTDPQAAAALVAEARENSAKALDELRGLVRGICPPVLADRGLGDAVRALALDTPLPTDAVVELPGRPPLPVETACYFAVAEVLANTVKHAGARCAQIRIWHADGALKITVFDDGSGGADPRAGTGLLGLERRLGMFDGVLAVNSPVGGPTIVAIDVPCVLKEDTSAKARPRSMASMAQYGG